MKNIFFLLPIFLNLNSAQVKYKEKVNQQASISCNLASNEVKIKAEHIQDQTNLNHLINSLNTNLQNNLFGPYIGLEDCSQCLNLTINVDEGINCIHGTYPLIFILTEAAKLKGININTGQCVFELNEVDEFYISPDSKTLVALTSEPTISLYKQMCTKDHPLDYSYWLYFIDVDSVRIIYKKKYDSGLRDNISLTNDSLHIFQDSAFKIVDFRNRKILHKKTNLNLSYCAVSIQIGLGLILKFSRNGQLELYDCLKDKKIDNKQFPAPGRFTLNRGASFYIQKNVINIILCKSNKIIVNPYEFDDSFEITDAYRLYDEDAWLLKLKKGEEILYTKFNIDECKPEGQMFKQKGEILFANSRYYVVKVDNTIQLKEFKTHQIKISENLEYYDKNDHLLVCCDNNLFCILTPKAIKIFLLPDVYDEFNFAQKHFLHDLAKAKKSFNNKTITFNEKEQDIFESLPAIIQHMIKSNFKIEFFQKQACNS